MVNGDTIHKMARKGVKTGLNYHSISQFDEAQIAGSDKHASLNNMGRYLAEAMSFKFHSLASFNEAQPETRAEMFPVTNPRFKMTPTSY